MEVTGAANANDALHRFYTSDWPRARVAELAMTVDRIAQEGDPVGAEILRSAAQHLALLVASVRRQLWNEPAVSSPIRVSPILVSWIGGVFRSQILLERFRALILLDGNAEAGPPRRSPAAGALTIAYRAAGLNVRPHPVDGIKT